MINTKQETLIAMTPAPVEISSALLVFQPSTTTYDAFRQNLCCETGTMSDEPDLLDTHMERFREVWEKLADL